MYSFAAGPAISDADEARIGRILAEKFVKERGLAPTPQAENIEKYLQTVGDRVAVNASRQLPYKFHFDPDPRFRSAVALPGGQIFVGGGILALLENEDQLAAMLGHEIEHVALNQCQDRLLMLLGERHLSLGDGEKLSVREFFGGYGHDGEIAAGRRRWLLAHVGRSSSGDYSASGGTLSKHAKRFEDDAPGAPCPSPFGNREE
jgi:hypothetical protein